MTRRLRTIVCGAAALLVTLLCGLSPHGPLLARHTTIPLSDASRADHDVVLPPGFAATVDRATSDQFVRVVADDVDRDGDIDVVASLDSLDLIVWQNDGAGHFTRLPSSSHTALQTSPPAPSVDGDPLASNEWIQNGQQRGVDLESLRARRADEPESAFSPTLCPTTVRYGPRVRSPRAPPILPAL
jgi:hypothetical protein